MVSENSTFITQSNLYGNTGTITWFRNKKKEEERLKAESDTVENLNVTQGSETSFHFVLLHGNTVVCLCY